MAVVSLTSYSCGTTTYSTFAPLPCSFRNVSRISLSRSTRGVWLWPQKVTSAPPAAGAVFGFAAAGVAGCGAVVAAGVGALGGAACWGVGAVAPPHAASSSAAAPPRTKRRRPNDAHIGSSLRGTLCRGEKRYVFTSTTTYCPSTSTGYVSATYGPLTRPGTAGSVSVSATSAEPGSTVTS